MARRKHLMAIASLLAGSALALTTAGCASDNPAPNPMDPTDPEAQIPPVSVDPTDEVDVTPPPRSEGREWRRMDLDQLEASIVRVTGGITWTELDEEGQPFDVLQSLAGSLGKPDFLNSNTEELEPNLLFQKFLDDGANSVCRTWLDQEVSMAPSERRLVALADFSDTLDSAPEAIEANIRANLLRFHGRPVAVGDPSLEPWTKLFRTVWELRSSTQDAWRVVCVGLFTHPDFYTF